MRCGFLACLRINLCFSAQMLLVELSKLMSLSATQLLATLFNMPASVVKPLEALLWLKQACVISAEPGGMDTLLAAFEKVGCQVLVERVKKYVSDCKPKPELAAALPAACNCPFSH
jgi:hypothetical protein